MVKLAISLCLLVVLSGCAEIGAKIYLGNVGDNSEWCTLSNPDKVRGC